MAHLIDKDALVAEIESKFQKYWKMGEDSDALQDGNAKYWGGVLSCINEVKTLIDTLEVKDPYEQCIQYASIKAGIQAHAETYSFNIESELFNQLTKEQQKLWRKEIEQAVISGGEMGVEFAKDQRYKENLEVKEVDLDDYYHKFLEKEWFGNNHVRTVSEMMAFTAKHFFELALSLKNNKAQKGKEI